MVAAQAIAEAAHGEDGLIAELAPQVVDVDLDSVAADRLVPAVQLFLELGARHDRAGALGERREQGELAARHLDRRAVPPDRVRRRVQHQGAALDQRLRASGRTPRQRAHARGKLVEVERLDEIVVGAGVESGDAVTHRVACRHHQDRKVELAGTQALEDFEPVAPGQSEVEQDEAIGRRRDGGLRRHAVAHPVDRVSLTCEPADHAFADHRVVLDQQDAHFRRPPFAPSVAPATAPAENT